MIIPFNIPTFLGEETELVLKSLKSLKHCGNNNFSRKCRDLLIDKYGFLDVFFTTSCTTAMEMGVLLCDIKPGDEVILPSYTFSSTANSFVLRGGIPVFCEIDRKTMNIDHNKIEPLITKKTKLIMPIDYAGIPCEITKINEIAKKYNLHVLQDSAQSFHSVHKNGKYCAAAAPLAAFSFHETKNINCGEGGALVINDPDLIERAHFLQEKGTDRSLVLKGVKSKYRWVDLGSSFLLSDILAAMLLSQVKQVEKIVDKRSVVTNAYRELFQPYVDNGCLDVPVLPKEVVINNHAFFIIFNSSENQEKFLSFLKEKHIYAYIGYMPLHSSPMGQNFGYHANDLPVTEDLASRIVRLPFYTDLQGESLKYCIDGMQSVLRIIYDL
jgi:dTDP-4-amino-4,6-dideoxygalactose transaminase